MTSLAVLVVVALAIVASVSSKNIISKKADKDFLIKQKFFLDIFQHIYQDDVFVTKFDQSYYGYKPWEHLDDFRHPELFKDFIELWQHKPLLDDEVFSIFYDRHMEYASGLARMLYFAKNWNTFSHVVFWARQNCNKQLFIYSTTIGCLFHKDLEGIVLPAIYEINPFYFFDAETLESAKRHRMHNFHNDVKVDNLFSVVIKSNYSNAYGNINDDSSLAYFLEDIGLNSFYYYFNLDYPYWARGHDGRELKNDRRGELWIFLHTQLLARYYMERLSNGLGGVPTFNMYDTVDSGHFSGLHYYSGMSFPNRDNHYNFYYPENIEYIKNIALFTNRILNFIDENTKPELEAVNILGNIIQGNADSINRKYYGSLDRNYRYVANEGRPYGKHQESLPGTILYYETSLRDPLFFEMYKEITSYYWRLTATFPEYTKKDLIFEGVKIDKVTMPENLFTYFEYFDADISNAVNVGIATETKHDDLLKFGRNSHLNGRSYVIKARQYRLNHKPFEFALDVSSDKDQHAIVKIFIGPKYNENGKLMLLENNYMNFFELDHFAVNLVAGANTIKRHSNDFTSFVNDRTTYFDLYKKIMDATNNSNYTFQLNQLEAHCSVPQRIMLPKGKKDGSYFQFFFMVYKYLEPTVKQYTGYDPVVSCGVGTGARFVDNLPFGFPFNRPVSHDYYYDVDNFLFHDVKIFHETENI